MDALYELTQVAYCMICLQYDRVICQRFYEKRGTGKNKGSQFRLCFRLSFLQLMSKVELEVVDIENPASNNLIFGQTHFIKSVEDIYEALVQSGTALRFGIAFCEVREQIWFTV